LPDSRSFGEGIEQWTFSENVADVATEEWGGETLGSD
jgi:hypothetical protein